jgi:hypothetical protein
MTDSTQLERRVAAHYATEAPARAPAWVLERALDAIETTSQRRVLVQVPWRFPVMTNFAKLAAAAVVVVAVGAVGFAVLRPGSSGPGVQASPSPSLSASPSPSPAPSASAGSTERQPAIGFSPPFSYVLPAGAEFAVLPLGQALFEIRIPAAAETGTPSGLIVQAIGGGRVDPCQPASDAQSIGAGPQAVIEYLRTVPNVRVNLDGPSTVATLEARDAAVAVVDGPADCPEVWPWAQGVESMPQGNMRIIAVDVGGEHVVLTIYGEDANPAWDTMADELIGSIVFESEASPSASPSP